MVQHRVGMVLVQVGLRERGVVVLVATGNERLCQCLDLEGERGQALVLQQDTLHVGHGVRQHLHALEHGFMAAHAFALGGRHYLEPGLLQALRAVFAVHRGAARQQQLPMHVENVHARWQPHPNIQRVHRNEWRSAHGAIVNLYAPLWVCHCWS